MKQSETTAVYKKLPALVLAIVLLAVAGHSTRALSAEPGAGSDTWMSVLLDGRKIGHAHFSSSRAHDKVTTRQKLHLTMHRDGNPMVIETVQVDTESDTGKPLQFRSVTRLSDAESTVVGKRRDDGRFDITRSVGGKNNTSIIKRPPGALLSEGQRLAALQAGTRPGTRYDFPAWDVNSGKVLTTHNTVIGKQQIDLPGGNRRLVRIDQTTELPVGSIDTSLWLDEHYHALKIRTSMLGMKLELLACDKHCAMAPDQDLDLLDKSMVQLPQSLTRQARSRPITYVIKATGDKPLHFARTGEQQSALAADGTWRVTVSNAHPGGEGPPEPADTQANDWLQSDNRRLRQLAQKESRGTDDDAQRMLALQGFVGRYITRKNLGVGYASALEVMHNREGDCTEHAVLLAALGRAIDIPTRVVTGLVYADHYAGRDHVLVPHAWVQSWVDGRWRSFDAALGGFDTGHIALETGDGDPWHFFSAINTLGRIRVQGVSSKAAAGKVPAG